MGFLSLGWGFESPIISADNEFELMLYLAKLKFERSGFSFGRSPSRLMG